MLTRKVYVQTAAPRFRLEATPEGQRVVIPAQRQIFMTSFLAVWLCGWTLGGMTAISTLFLHFQSFVALWCCGWALGEIYALAVLTWMLAGKETLRVVHGDLEITAQIPRFARRRLYRGADIRRLCATATVANRYRRTSGVLPLLQAPTAGCVKFDYGARTIFAGVGLDEPEGRLIVDALKPRLPKTATASDYP